MKRRLPPGHYSDVHLSIGNRPVLGRIYADHLEIPDLPGAAISRESLGHPLLLPLFPVHLKSEAVPGGRITATDRAVKTWLDPEYVLKQILCAVISLVVFVLSLIVLTPGGWPWGILFSAANYCFTFFFFRLTLLPSGRLRLYTGSSFLIAHLASFFIYPFLFQAVLIAAAIAAGTFILSRFRRERAMRKLILTAYLILMLPVGYSMVLHTVQRTHAEKIMNSFTPVELTEKNGVYRIRGLIWKKPSVIAIASGSGRFRSAVARFQPVPLRDWLQVDEVRSLALFAVGLPGKQLLDFFDNYLKKFSRYQWLIPVFTGEKAVLETEPRRYMRSFFVYDFFTLNIEEIVCFVVEGRAESLVFLFQLPENLSPAGPLALISSGLAADNPDAREK